MMSSSAFRASCFVTFIILNTLHAQQIIFPGATRGLSSTSTSTEATTVTQNGVEMSLCYPQDSCNIRGNSRDVLSLEHRSCQCDEMCREHGDCCVDSTKYDETSALNAKYQWKCTGLRHYYGIFLKVACPSDWQDQDVRRLCESNVTEDDPMRKLPVTSRVTQLSYKNYYCALCNDDMSSPIYWIPHVECGDRPLNFSFGSLGFWDTVEFNDRVKSWGFYLRNGSFISCTVDAEMPTTVVDFVRKCVPFIDDCHSNWTDDEIRRRCHSYTSYLYEGDKAYRNHDCAVCNYAESLTCVRIVSRFAGGKFNSHIFTMLFDVNERQGNIVGNVQHCVDTEIYDPFARKCRSVICGSKNYSFVDGRCTSLHVTTDKSTETSTTSTTPFFPDVVVFPLEEEIYVEEPENEFTTIAAEIASESQNNITEPVDVLLSFEGDNIEVSTTSTNDTDNNSTTNCDKFMYNESDYLLLDNGSIYLKIYNRILSPKDFQQETNKIYVCIKTLLGDNYSNYSDKFSPYLSIVSIVGLGISLTCLLMHLICFFFVQDLQNLSGKNLASLCVALIIGYTTFITSQFSSIPKEICTVIGVTMFYAFLSSFFWMNTMAFDVWRALRQATTELRVSSGQQWRKFIVYSAYSWLSPAMIVGISVIVENVQSIPEDFRPGFGLVLCWFSRRRALLLFFVVPVVTVILINVVLFSLSALMIVATTKNAAKLHSTKSQRNFRLYLRLALLMGLTWIVGIIAALSDVEPLWHVFVIFNTLQGLFIFFAFTCTKKVLNSLFGRVHGRGKRKSGKSSTFIVDSCNSGVRNQQMKNKSGLEARDSADSYTSRSSLTQTTTTGSIEDTLY